MSPSSFAVLDNNYRSLPILFYMFRSYTVVFFPRKLLVLS